MTQYMILCAVSVVICYLFGSIMFGVIISKIASKDDVRQHGSGNAGATNVLRVLGLKAGLITFAGDMIKCIIAMLLCKYLLILPYSEGLELNIMLQPQTVMYYCGFAALIGHSFPLFFQFKGGKAVSSSLGVLLCINWQVALAVLLAFIVVVVLTRIVSLGSIMGALQFIILTFFMSESLPILDRLYITLWGLMIGCLVIIRHKQNISRLMSGEEKPINLKK